jgi:hypothetical protein
VKVELVDHVLVAVIFAVICAVCLICGASVAGAMAIAAAPCAVILVGYTTELEEAGDLAPARGIWLGVLIGAGAWLAIAAVAIGLLFLVWPAIAWSAFWGRVGLRRRAVQERAIVVPSGERRIAFNSRERGAR